MADQQNPQQDWTEPPKKSDLKLLPRWARVAFASRCARRVRPLFVKHWPDAPAKHVAAVDRAIELAESSARVGRDDDLIVADAAAAAYAAADAAAAYAAAAAAAAAAYAAAAADDAYVAADDAYAAADAATAADDAAADAAAAAAITRCMWFDYDLLTELAKLNAWTDDSPVDPDLCGVLWPFGKLEGWPSDPEKPDDVCGLKVIITVPDDLSDEQVANAVAAYVRQLDALHRALGGKGLRVIPPIGVSQPTPVVQGVGS